jgi:hypothetical protein
VHRSFGQQLENCDADVAALAAASPAAATRTAGAAEAEAETAARIESELEAAAGTEAGTEATPRTEARAGVVLAEMVTEVFTELAASQPALLMKCAPVVRAEAERAWGWSEWVGHFC